MCGWLTGGVVNICFLLGQDGPSSWKEFPFFLHWRFASFIRFTAGLLGWDGIYLWGMDWDIGLGHMDVYTESGTLWVSVMGRWDGSIIIPCQAGWLVDIRFGFGILVWRALV